MPAPALAQAWRGENPVRLVRLLAGCEIDVLDGAIAKAIGKLLTRSRTSDIVDGAVVVGALRRGDAIVTSDPDDIRQLLAATGRPLQVLLP